MLVDRRITDNLLVTDNMIATSDGANGGLVLIDMTTAARLVVGRGDGTILFWHAATRTQSGDPLVVSDKSVESIDVSPDGRLLAVGLSNVPDVTVFEMPSRQPIGTLRANLGTVSALRFSSDSSRLGAGDTEGRLTVFDTSAASWRDRLCRIVGRSITETEWATLIGPGERPDTCTR